MRAQTFADWEAIVVDDHSQDNSVGVARRYAESDSRIRVVSRRSDRKGGNICRNEGLSLAQGDYVIFLDSDDLLAPFCLEHRVAAMDHAPDSGFGVYQTEIFTKTIGDRQLLWNVFIEANDLHRFLSLDTVWLTTGPIWRKKVLTQLGGFDEDVLSFQDWALHVRALIAGIKYFKAPFRDSFHRFEHEPKLQISMASNSPEHLQSREGVLDKTLHKLRHAGLLDVGTGPRLAGLFWWLATIWVEQGNLKTAVRVWRKAFALALCSSRRYLEGCLILKLKSARRGAPIIQMIQRSWPPKCILPSSLYLRRTPVGDTALEPISSKVNRRESTSNGANSKVIS